MPEIYDLLTNPIVALIFSFLGIIVSVLGVLYNRNLNDITLQQYELDKERFLAEIARQGPLIQIAKSNIVYSLETSNKPEKTDILRGKLKGYRYKPFFGPEAKISFREENSIVRMKEVYLDLSVIATNASDVTIKIENISIVHKFRPEIFWYFRLIGSIMDFTLFDRVSSSELFSENYCEFRTENDKFVYSGYKRRGAAGYLDLRWDKFCELFIQLCKDGDLIDKDIEFIEEKTAQLITAESFFLQPKSKKNWRIKMRFSKKAAQALVKHGYGPKDITVVLPWEGDVTAKFKQLEHVYTINDSKDTHPYWTIKIADLKYY